MSNVVQLHPEKDQEVDSDTTKLTNDEIYALIEQIDAVLDSLKPVE
jgi:hypothetical protein